MNNGLIIGLINNTALLLAIGVLYNAIFRRPLRSLALRTRIISGLAIGVVGVAIMLNAVPFGTGVVFDTRSILLSISGLFFGAIPALIAATLIGAYRIYLGGAGALTGLTVILTSTGIGLAWRTLRRTQTRQIVWGELYLFGFLVHVVMLICMFTLPWETAVNVLRQIGLPVMLLYPLGTVLLGATLSNQRARLEIEEALRQSRNRFQLATHAARAAVWEVSLPDLKTESDGALEQLIGYEQGDIQDWYTVTHPEDRERLQKLWQTIAAGELDRYDTEHRMLHKDGSIVWVSIDGKVVKDKHGQPDRIVGTTRNITARKQAELTLQKREALLNKTQQLAHIGAWEWDIAAQRMAWSEETYRLHGFSEVDIQSGSPEHIERSIACYDPDDQTILLEAFQRCTESGQGYDLDLPFTSMQGRRMWVRTTAEAVQEDDRIVSVIGNIMDITDQKHAEEALKESEKRYRSLFQSLTTGFALHEVICDEDGEPVDYRFLEINPAFEQLTGLKAQELIGKTVLEVLPGTEPYWIKTYGRVALSGEALQFENYSQELDRYYEVSAYSTQPGQFATLFLDVTERKKAELEIERSRGQLRALNSYMETAIENERAAIAREIHDEFGQILTAIKMDLSWLKRGMNEDDPKVNRIEEMTVLVDDAIRIIRRISSNLRPGILDDLGLVAALEWQAQEFERRYGIAATVRLPEDELNLPPELSTALFRIFQEALTNVARHARAAQVIAGLTIDRGELVLVVSDDGVGIPREELLDLNSLGLLGMRERAARWDGKLRITGRPGKGTIVTTRIPYPFEDSARGGP